MSMAHCKYPIPQRRLFALIGLFLLLFCLTACRKAEPDVKPIPTATAQSLIAKMNLTMHLPEEARITQWVVSTDVSGRSFPQADFVYQDISWSYGAMRTDEAQPFHFVGTEEEWTESEEFLIGTIPCAAHVSDHGDWVGWVEDGICHNIFSELCTMEDLKTILKAMLAVDHPDLIAELEAQEAVHEVPGARASLFKGIWKYDDEDRYLYIWDNMTYDFCGADMKKDKVIRFCAMSGDKDALELLDSTGDCLIWLTAQEEGETIRLTDSNGRTLSASTAVMNGKYYCYLGDWSLDGTTDLWLTDFLELWVSDSQALALKAGEVLHFENVMVEDIPLESVEEKEDGWLVLNGTLDLKRSASAEAWKLTGLDFQWISWLGNCRMNADTKITDTLDGGRHKDLRKCFEAHDPDAVMGYVRVKNGIVTSIEITDIYQ